MWQRVGTHAIGADGPVPAYVVLPHDWCEPHSWCEMTLRNLMRQAEEGEPAATNELFAVLYRELHVIAESQLRRTGDQVTLGATTLLHEAYLRLSEREGIEFPDRTQFLSYASKAMRGLVIDFIRARRAVKRGGQFEITGIGDGNFSDATDSHQDRIESLNVGLEELSLVDPRLAQLVDLHFFCGFSFAEIAAMRDVSERTIQRDWRKAKMLLGRILTDDG